MKRTILQYLTAILCFAAVTGCGKEVKAPSEKIAAKTTANSAATVTQTSTEGQNSHSCGSQSGSYGNTASSGSSGSY